MAFFKLSIGIELECFFAFHQHVLEHVLDRAGSGTRIVKDLSDEQRIQLAVGAGSSGNTAPYQSWGLTNRDSDRMDFPRRITLDQSARSYSYEPLSIAADVIGQGVSVRCDDRLWSNLDHDDVWQVAHNGDLPGLSKDVLREELAGQVAVEELEKWDCVDIRLTSRLIPAPTSSMDSNPFDEIARVMNLLRGSHHLGYRTFATNQCGIRVRLGLDGRLLHHTAPLQVLQHLAYILVLYEKVIDSLHPPHRRGEEWSLSIERNSIKRARVGNREYFLANPMLSTSPSYAAMYLENGNLFLSHQVLAPIDIIQYLIFSQLDTDALASIMSPPGNRNMVNWTDLTETEASNEAIPRFIDFRQHEATLDPLEIEHWIRFVVSLLQAAQIKIATPTPWLGPGQDALIDAFIDDAAKEGQKYNISTLEDIHAYPTSFMYLLNLDSAAQEHWMRRFNRFEQLNRLVQDTRQPLPARPTNLRKSPGVDESLFGCDCGPSTPGGVSGSGKGVHFPDDPVTGVQALPSRKRRWEEEEEDDGYGDGRYTGPFTRRRRLSRPSRSGRERTPLDSGDEVSGSRTPIR